MKKRLKKFFIIYFLFLLLSFCLNHFVSADTFSSYDYKIFEMSSSNYYAYPFQSGSFDNIDANKPFNISVIWSNVNLLENMPSTINLEFAVSDNNFSLSVFNRTPFCNATIKKSTAKYSGQFSDVYKVILTLSSTKALGDSSFTDRECHLQMIPQNWTRFMFIGATNDTSIDIDNNKETNQKLDSLKEEQKKTQDIITSEDFNTPDFSGISWAPDTPVSNLVLMPLNVLNRIVTAFSGSCSPYNLTFFDNTILTFPCFNGELYFGSNLWSTIDSLMCLFMIYEIGMFAISAFEDFTSLRDTYDKLYVPKHAKPLGKHTKEVQ